MLRAANASVAIPPFCLPVPDPTIAVNGSLHGKIRRNFRQTLEFFGRFLESKKFRPFSHKNNLSGDKDFKIK